MYMLLTGAPVLERLNKETKAYIQQHNLEGKYVAIFLLSDDTPSEVYVQLKAKQAKKLGLYGDILLGKDWSVEEVLDEINMKNNDEDCLGMIVQLPIAEHLKEHQGRILSAILPEKDLDGLGGVGFGLSGFGVLDFVPATPKAVLEILKQYQLDDVRGKTVTIIGQSNLIGKPLAIELMKRGATVISCNSKTKPDVLQQALLKSDYIMSATGRKHIVNKDSFVSAAGEVTGPRVQISEKVLIDIGRGMDEGKAYGDIDREYFEGKVKAVTPVPGGVGPVTVASLFHNITVLGEQKDRL